MKLKPGYCRPWGQSSVAQEHESLLWSAVARLPLHGLGTSPRDITQDSLGLPSEVGPSQKAPSKLKTENLSPLWEGLLSPPRLLAGGAEASPSHDVMTHPEGSCHRKSKDDDDLFFFLATHILPSIILGQLPQGLSPTLVSPTQTYYNSKEPYL